MLCIRYIYKKFTLNESKTVYGAGKLCFLGYCVKRIKIKLNPKGLKLLMKFQPPINAKSLKEATATLVITQDKFVIFWNK